MGEDMIPAGLGTTLFVCRADDLKKNPDAPMELLGEPISIGPGILTYKDDDDRSHRTATKGFSIGFDCTMEKPSPELLKMIYGPQLVGVTIQQKLGRMPRKMKKAYRADYPRNTKWKRKVANYIRRMTYTIPQAEIVVTKEQHNRLAALISAELTISDRQGE